MVSHAVSFLALSTLLVGASAACSIVGTPTCVVDNFNEPILKYWAYNAPAAEMNWEKCASVCFAYNPTFTVFGLENSAQLECWCGTPPVTAPAPSSDCNNPCPANSAQICGGAGTNMTMGTYNCAGGGGGGGGGGGSPSTPPSPAHPHPGSVNTKKSQTYAGGWVYLGVMLLLLIIYFAGATIYLAVARNQRGVEMIPHREFILGIPGYFVAGCKKLKSMLSRDGHTAV